MKNHILSTVLIINMLSFSTVWASSNFNYSAPQTPTAYSNNYYQQPLQYPHNNTLQGNVVMVPAGTSVKATLTAPLSSQYTNVGQTVSMVLNSDFYYGDRLIAPAGSTLYGSIIESSKAKRGGINGKLSVRFSQIFTPYGAQIPISAVIKTDDLSGVLVGGTKLDVAKEYTKDLTAGSAAGALSGLVFGALAGGDVGKGAALGTAVGAGGGLVKSIWDKGNDVEIPVNANIDVVFTQPITVSGQTYFHEN